MADNDVLKKLAICDLLDEAISAFGVSPKEILVLPTARFKLLTPKNPNKGRAQLGNDAYERLQAFLDNAGVLDARPSPDDQKLFEDALDIDPGEAILFSATAHFSDFLVATGDKRCLRALHGLSHAERIRARVAGRIICFEQILSRIISCSGFGHVRTKLVPACGCDTVLRVAFGSGLNATEESVTRCLTIYTEHLRRETGSLLAPV
ncbi:MAG TPA: hypothetical protein VFE24_17760 [Pirellulales bacterium]|nr:hypothetical protein [Pirellulales bacterium]